MGADREYVNIPGNKMHELPPLLVRRLSETPEVDMASAIVEAEEMLPEVGWRDLWRASRFGGRGRGRRGVQARPGHRGRRQ